jgi:hypothetical protein
LRIAHGECAAGHALPARKRVHPESADLFPHSPLFTVNWSAHAAVSPEPHR